MVEAANTLRANRAIAMCWNLAHFFVADSQARFRLVPRIVKEPRFWRNYFYRISVIRVSFLASLLPQPVCVMCVHLWAHVLGSPQDSYRLMGESSKTPLATRTGVHMCLWLMLACHHAHVACCTESSAPLAAVLPVAAQPPPSSGAPPADEEAPVPSAQSEQPLGPPAVLSSAGSEDAFVMVEDDPDAFESALEAALNDTDGGLNAAMPGDGEGDLGELTTVSCNCCYCLLAYVMLCLACPNSNLPCNVMPSWCRRRTAAAHRSRAGADGLIAVNTCVFLWNSF